jgi:RNA polymerase sigma-70 factor (ECF subfamily)
LTHSIDDELMAVLASADSAGRERAFRELVRRHAAALTRWVDCVVCDPGHSDDVVQETFLRVFQARERYTPGAAAFRTWLYRIARNRALDGLRAQKRRPVERLASDAGPVLADPSPEATLLARERAERLRAAVETLPPGDREAVLLRYDEELSYDAIADLIGASASAVKQRVFRARKRLRALMEDLS